MESNLSSETKEALRLKLCSLEKFVLERILVERDGYKTDELAAVSEETAADVIYAIDRIADAAIKDWFEQNWDNAQPVQIIMEGLEESEALTFPNGTPVEATALKCIIDPIDGTRGIMYDKRSAWILAGIAPQRGEANTLADIEIAAMTEIPTTRQWRADQLSAYRGGGLKSIAFDVRNQFSETPLTLQPSQADQVLHAFATVSRFFPEACTLLAEFEEALWQAVYGKENGKNPLIFNDQYISTGGQFYEVLSGHDRFIADIRPLAFRKLGIENKLACHPYDVACALLLEEAGCIIEGPGGLPLNCPLDTTSPVSWVVYANTSLAATIRPAFKKTLEKVLL
ncbi:MAG: inositol monophosphatase [Verrucomicrobiota bacterium]